MGGMGVRNLSGRGNDEGREGNLMGGFFLRGIYISLYCVRSSNIRSTHELFPCQKIGDSRFFSFRGYNIRREASLFISGCIYAGGVIDAYMCHAVERDFLFEIPHRILIFYLYVLTISATLIVIRTIPGGNERENRIYLAIISSSPMFFLLINCFIKRHRPPSNVLERRVKTSSC